MLGTDFAVEPTKETRDILGQPVDSNLTETLERRIVRFKTVKPLPKATPVVVTLESGIPSMEGPRTTTSRTTYSFYTYGPFLPIKSRCGWGRDCRPHYPFSISFSNPIDCASFSDGYVSIHPEVRNLKRSCRSNELNLQGSFKSNTQYTVNIDAALSDVFGQSLSDNHEASFTTEEGRSLLRAEGGNMVVLDPFSGGRYSVFSQNMASIEVQMWSVKPEHWRQYMEFPNRRVKERMIFPRGCLLDVSYLRGMCLLKAKNTSLSKLRSISIPLLKKGEGMLFCV